MPNIQFVENAFYPEQQTHQLLSKDEFKLKNVHFVI